MNESFFGKNKIYVILIFTLILFGFVIYLVANGEKIKKVDSAKDYVYTSEEKYSGTSNYSRLPVINIKNDFYKNINDDIKVSYDSIVIDSNKSFNYEYYLVGNLLSLVTKIIDVGEISLQEPVYETYNLDVKNNVSLSNEEFINKLNLTAEAVVNEINETITSYYEAEIEKEYILAEYCDFNCYIENLQINSLNYIKDGKMFLTDKNELSVYLPIKLDYYLTEGDTAPSNPQVFKISF